MNPEQLVDELVRCGITSVFAYPGHPADDVLAAADDDPRVELTVTTAESAAGAAAHGHWMVTGAPAGLLLSDGAGVETAAAMIALAVREGVGMLVVVPGLLPGPTRTGPILTALGAVVMRCDETDLSLAVALAGSGRVVAVVAGDYSSPAPAVTKHSDTSADHDAIVIGPGATAAELAAAAKHSCPVMTTAGVLPPAELHSRWLGPIVLGTHPAVFDLIGLGQGVGGRLLTWGCSDLFGEWLQTLGEGVEVHTDDSGKCLTVATRDQPTSAESPLIEALTAVSAALPAAVLVGDAGASHKAVAYAGRRTRVAVLSTLGATTMGWGPGAALGAALANAGPVILTIGDGALAMSGLQLLDWHRYGVAGVIVAAQNSSLGSIVARLGHRHPNLVSCDLSSHRLFEALDIPWREVGARHSPDAAAQWAADVAKAGGRAALVVDTSGRELEEYRMSTGLNWWDEFTRQTSLESTGTTPVQASEGTRRTV